MCFPLYLGLSPWQVTVTTIVKFFVGDPNSNKPKVATLDLGGKTTQLKNPKFATWNLLADFFLSNITSHFQSLHGDACIFVPCCRAYQTIHWFSIVKDEPEATMFYQKKDTQRNDGRESARTANRGLAQEIFESLGRSEAVAGLVLKKYRIIG